jgi:hypothetical protein
VARHGIERYLALLGRAFAGIATIPGLRVFPKVAVVADLERIELKWNVKLVALEALLMDEFGSSREVERRLGLTAMAIPVPRLESLRRDESWNGFPPCGEGEQVFAGLLTELPGGCFDRCYVTVVPVDDKDLLESMAEQRLCHVEECAHDSFGAEGEGHR